MHTNLDVQMVRNTTILNPTKQNHYGEVLPSNEVYGEVKSAHKQCKGLSISHQALTVVYRLMKLSA